MKRAEVCHEIGFEESPRNEKKSALAVKAGKVIKSLKGAIAASFGTTEGPAFVLTGSHSVARIPEGSVLICTAATPDLTVFFPRLSALVAERGGMLSVAAAAARRNAIPAVLGVPGLTAAINDGDIVRVDGRKGVVKVMKSSL